MTRVAVGSAAAVGGLQVGDLLVRTGNKLFHSKQHVYLALLETRPGEMLALDILRNTEDPEGLLEQKGGKRSGKALRAAQNAHKPMTLKLQMGAAQYPYQTLLAILRLANHLQQPTIYGSSSPETLFTEDLKHVSKFLHGAQSSVEQDSKINWH